MLTNDNGLLLVRRRQRRAFLSLPCEDTLPDGIQQRPLLGCVHLFLRQVTRRLTLAPITSLGKGIEEIPLLLDRQPPTPAVGQHLPDARVLRLQACRVTLHDAGHRRTSWVSRSERTRPRSNSVCAAACSSSFSRN